MSPTAFRGLVDQLKVELNLCIELCHAIRLNRHISSSHKTLDALESALRAGPSNIEYFYKSAKKSVDSRIDLGDDLARREMEQHINEIRSRIKPRLSDTALPSYIRPRTTKENPGFRQLLKQWETTETGVTYTFKDLAQRLSGRTAAATKSPSPTPVASTKRARFAPDPTTATYELPRQDQVTMPAVDYEILMEHMKSSWREEYVGDRLLYVNAFDPEKAQWERPSGFIQAASRRPVRRGSFERRSPRI